MTADPKLERLIQATRTARDNAARAEELARDIQAYPLANSLGQLAAGYDRLLAQALKAQHAEEKI